MVIFHSFLYVYQRVSGKAPPVLLVGSHPPNAGLIHLAAVLDDATMPKLTRGHLEKSYGAKVRSLIFFASERRISP